MGFIYGAESFFRLELIKTQKVHRVLGCVKVIGVCTDVNEPYNPTCGALKSSARLVCARLKTQKVHRVLGRVKVIGVCTDVNEPYNPKCGALRSFARLVCARLKTQKVHRVLSRVKVIVVYADALEPSIPKCGALRSFVRLVCARLKTQDLSCVLSARGTRHRKFRASCLRVRVIGVSIDVMEPCNPKCGALPCFACRVFVQG